MAVVIRIFLSIDYRALLRYSLLASEGESENEGRGEVLAGAGTAFISHSEHS